MREDGKGNMANGGWKMHKLNSTIEILQHTCHLTLKAYLAKNQYLIYGPQNSATIGQNISFWSKPVEISQKIAR